MKVLVPCRGTVYKYILVGNPYPLPWRRQYICRPLGGGGLNRKREDKRNVKEKKCDKKFKERDGRKR